MITRKIPRRSLKIFCGVTIVFLIIIATIVTTLSLTIFKPKEPEVHLDNFDLTYFPNGTLTVKVNLLVIIKNQNYGSLKYKQTIVNVTYQGIDVATVPLEPRLVPARRKLNFTITSVDILVNKMMESPKFLDDASFGSFNFTSSATLHGKVRVLKVFKLQAKVYCTCDVSYFIRSLNVKYSRCKTKIKL